MKTKPLLDAVVKSYAGASAHELDNKGLFNALVEHQVVSRAELSQRSEVGRTGAKHSLAQRSIRWLQQDLRRAGLLERDPARRGVWRLTGEGRRQFVRPAPKRVLLGFSTDLGVALWGAAEDVFARLDEPIVLALTSPPYPLAKARAYGNPHPTEYVDFICRIAEPVVRNLVRGGSLVLNISNDIFCEGSPARSTYLERLVLALESRLSLHLMDRLVWNNSAKVPAPTQWASLHRKQLNVAWEPCYWFCNEPRAVRSDNRRVLQAHTQRQLDLIAKGGEERSRRFSDGAYTLRPGKSFANPTQGSIARNVLKFGHACGGQKRYKEAAKALGLPVHGAPFPEALVDFLVRFLTEPGDLCVDFCAGSQTLPAVCERLGRPWISSEITGEFIRGGAERLRDAPGFTLHDDLIDGLRLKFSHPTWEGQQALPF